MIAGNMSPKAEKNTAPTIVKMGDIFGTAIAMITVRENIWISLAEEKAQIKSIGLQIITWKENQDGSQNVIIEGGISRENVFNSIPHEI